MKKIARAVCCFLVAIMIFHTVPHLPAFAEDVQSNDSVLLYDKAFMGVGDRCNFDWLVNVDSYYFTVTDTDIADYDNSNRSYIIGKAPGTTTVSLTYIEDNVIKHDQFQLEVLGKANLQPGSYRIRSAIPAFRYTICPYPEVSSVDVKRYTTELALETKWCFFVNEDGRCSIFSPLYSMYLCEPNESLQENDAPLLVSSLSTYRTYWNILRDANGKYVIAPESGANNLVLSLPTGLTANEGSVLFTNYYDYENNREYDYKVWDIYPENLTIHNYYDSSFMGRPILRNYVLGACDFVIDAYWDSLGITINKSNDLTRYVSSADGCTLEKDQACTDICSVDCSQHHKSRSRLVDQANAIPRDNNHVNVLWMNRSLAAYCDEVDGEHTTSGTVAYCAEGIPIFTVTGVSGVNSIEAYKTMMGLTLAHEIAHLYGLPEQYADYEPIHYWDEEGDPVHCCMDYTYYDDGVQDFYEAVVLGYENVFCPNCCELMAEKKILFHKNNLDE